MEKKLNDFLIFFMDKTKINKKGLEKRIMKVIQDECRYQQRMLESTVAMWDSAPKFGYKIYKEGDNLNFRVGLKKWADTGSHGESHDEWKWVWLNQGTKERWAIMSDPWVSKTKKGFMGSQVGQGHVVARGYGIGHARPGIKARGWTTMIMSEREGTHKRTIINALAVGTQNFWI